MVRTGSLLFALILAGCACEGGPHAPDAGRPPPSPPAPLDAQQRVVREWLRAQAISETHFAAPVLYAWLSDIDADAVRGGTSVVETAEASALDAALDGDRSDVAMQLLAPARDGRRIAWPTAWATRLGQAGDHLARIELRPESLLVVYDTRTSPPEIHFATEHGVAAPFEEASQVPELWAAVLWIRPRKREYFLISANMIGRVSMGTPEIAAELRVERERLTRLAHDLPLEAGPIAAEVVARAWSSWPGPDAPTSELFASVLTASDRYVLGRRTLMELVAELRDQSAPFDWQTSLPSEPRPHFFDR